MSVPINPNIPLLYYRADLYEQKGLKVPQTWDELLANAKALHNPPQIYGMVQRGARGPADVSYDWFPYLYGLRRRASSGTSRPATYFVTINSPRGEGRARLLHPARKGGRPPEDRRPRAGPGDPEHGHRQGGARDDGDRGLVADGRSHEVGRGRQDERRGSAACRPGTSRLRRLGHWLGGIPKNVPEGAPAGARSRSCNWFQTQNAQVRLHQGRRRLPSASTCSGSEWRRSPNSAG